MRPLRFRRVPFGRDVAFDPGGATASRIAMPRKLPSTVPSVSASARLLLSWLNPPPHPITVYASHPPSPTTAQHSLPAARYRLTGAGLSPAGSRQLRLTHRNRKFESSSLQRGVCCELRVRGRCRSRCNPSGRRCGHTWCERDNFSRVCAAVMRSRPAWSLKRPMQRLPRG